MVPAPSYVQTPAFQPRPLAGGNAFEDARVMRTWGLHWDRLERDPNLARRPQALFTAPLSEYHGPWATPRERRSRSLLARTVDGASVTM